LKTVFRCLHSVTLQKAQNHVILPLEFFDELPVAHADRSEAGWTLTY